MRLATTSLLLLLAACGSEQSSTSSSLTRTPGECGDVEAHVIGVYDGGGDATVILSRPGKHVLVMSAHEATTWHVIASDGATLEHVYATGVHAQKVVAPAGVDVKTESSDDGGASAVGYAYPDATTDALLKLAAARTHHDATSFHGCYYATQWTIGTDLETTSDCRTDMGYQQFDAITKCDGSGGDGTCGGSGDGPIL
jgi:hypothetical protein